MDDEQSKSEAASLDGVYTRKKEWVRPQAEKAHSSNAADNGALGNY